MTENRHLGKKLPEHECYDCDPDEYWMCPRHLSSLYEKVEHYRQSLLEAAEELDSESNADLDELRNIMRSMAKRLRKSAGVL